jgi:hypothetical protein
MSTVLGPEGGAAVGEAISQAATATVAWLGDRKRDRVSRTLTQVSEETARRIDAGEAVRPEIAEGEDAAALFEEVVEAAAQSVDEKKCEVIANLYASIAFDPSISVPDALLLVGRIRACSWRQLVALQFLVTGDREVERQQILVAGSEGDIDIAPILSAEFSELGSTLELIGTGMPGGRVSRPESTFGGNQVTSQSVAGMTPTAVGRELIRLGRLEDAVSTNELDDLGKVIAETRAGPN